MAYKLKEEKEKLKIKVRRAKFAQEQLSRLDDIKAPRCMNLGKAKERKMLWKIVEKIAGNTR